MRYWVVPCLSMVCYNPWFVSGKRLRLDSRSLLPIEVIHRRMSEIVFGTAPKKQLTILPHVYTHK